MVNDKCIIGITGGIGSGKSYVSDILRKHFNIPVYDCDKEAKRLIATDEEIRRQLILLVGPEVFSGQELNKKCLADYLFSDSEHAGKVNAIVHPAVHRDFQCSMSNVQCSIVGLESAILFESGFNKFVDCILFVDAPEEVRLHRAMQRDRATENQIRARMKMQLSEIYKDIADYVIDNGKTTKEDIIAQLEKIKIINQ